VRLSKHLAFNGAAVLDAACAMQLEGIICKQAASVYRSGRQDSWIKVKCTKSGTYPIIAFVEKPGSGQLQCILRGRAEHVGHAATMDPCKQRDHCEVRRGHEGQLTVRACLEPFLTRGDLTVD
jgi:ATP-dependent DNA ligase